MDNGWASFIVFLLCDPHLLEGGQGGQDRATDPDRVLTLRWGNDLGKAKRAKISEQATAAGGRHRSVHSPAHCLQEGKRRLPLHLGPSCSSLTLIFIVLGARAVISFCMRSAIPGYMVVPPDMTLLAYRSFLMSMSHFMMLL